MRRKTEQNSAEPVEPVLDDQSGGGLGSRQPRTSDAEEARVRKIASEPSSRPRSAAPKQRPTKARTK